MSGFIFGMHDYDPAWVKIVLDAGKTAWCVNTEAVGCDPNDCSGKCYDTHGGAITHIVRINNGYGSTGTIPLPGRYDDFARRCANFVAASTGANHWIIGNEIGLAWESPEGQRITLANYVVCFQKVYAAIKAVKPDAVVMPQPPAPWNAEVPDAPDWVDQLKRMLEAVQCDAIALHTYTHGHDPTLITSEEAMNPPYGHRRFHFRAYQDFMFAVPDSKRHLPVHITEANPDGWKNENNGWIRAAYAELKRWNDEPGHQQIHSLSFYRWPDLDREQFWIGSKPGVVEDFRQVLQNDYRWRKNQIMSKTLAPGSKVRALTVMNIRRTPGYNNKDASGSLADVVGATQAGEVLTLLEGPVQADGLDYYRIDRGWVASLAPGGERLLEEVLEKGSGARFRSPFQTPQPRTQGFGERPEFYAQFGLKAHQGVDWGCPVGTPIVAVADGTVAKAENDPAGFGLHVKIDHAFGNTTYAHLSEIHVNVGQPISEGQVLGLSGNTGTSSGPHLHFHVRVAPWDDQNGFFGCTDPELYLDSDAVVRADAAPQVAAPQPVAAPQLPSAKVGNIPSVFTYQNLLDAFYNVAGQLGLGNWDVLTKAGLDVAQLAQNRQAVYQGLALAALPNLSAAEKALVAVELVAQMRKAKKTTGTVNSPEGVNLRNGPASDQAILQLLQHQAELDVMHEEGDWLFVATGDGNAGHVHRNYVVRADAASQPTAPVVQPGAAGSRAMAGYLAAMPELISAPLAPSAAEQIALGGSAGPGAKLLAGIWNRYGGLLNVLAAKLGIDPAVAVAVLAVESGGNAFGSDGRMIIRFENHLFYHYWGKQNPDRFAQCFTFNSDRCWEGHTWRSDPNQPFQEFHGNQGAEWAALTFAASLDDTAAKFSISMGLPQVMGFNHQRIGYANVQEMFNAFAADERNHVLALFDFIKADASMVQALQSQNYSAFAAGYNGPGQADYYGGLIQKWVQGFGQLRQDPSSASFGYQDTDAPVLGADLDAAISFLPMPQPAAVFMQVTDPRSTFAQTTAAPAQPATTPTSTTAASAVTTEAPPAPAELPQVSQPAPAMDERLYNLWLEHIKHGFENNNIMFNRVLRAFMVPYYMTIAMYVVMFAVGIGLFVVAARLSSQQGTQLAGLFFGGMGIASFLGYFMSKPLRSLEENLQFITWLGIVYNTYWTRLLYMQNNTTIQADLKEATAEAVTQIEHMLNKNVEVAYKRPEPKEEK